MVWTVGWRGSSFADRSDTVTSYRPASVVWLVFRLAPVIPDYSEIGAYSGSLSAHVYNEAAANLPQLLIMLSFGDPVLNSSLKAFLEHLVLAEELLTRKDRRMTDKVVFKDRGPLLYWLANECPLPASLHPRPAPGFPVCC